MHYAQKNGVLFRRFSFFLSAFLHRRRYVAYVTVFDSEKTLTNVSCAPDWIRTSGHGIHWISRPTLYHLSQHVPPPPPPRPPRNQLIALLLGLLFIFVFVCY